MVCFPWRGQENFLPLESVRACRKEESGQQRVNGRAWLWLWEVQKIKRAG